ncbi:preprotein translocase subunit SecA [Tengunoibacter tsumagoiensis]|uniref:Protein translocase subunit SecA n=1 Tax=Tengunoibacter tsumagoiensis TaxID=2014871 RepID=A0A402A415_9CHLR|nr:preprotein translocase subunit SecA [Tengunoibacter tsumagoiensis]GCE13897.1 protein translocase subunit SecA [Tengunoibacter tsumagoiensis]
MQLLGKILGDPNKRDLKAIQPLIDKINTLEPEMKALSDEALSAKTTEFRSQLALYLKGGMVLEDELVKLFREALQKVEPLADRCSDEQLHAAVMEFRQKLDLHDSESALREHLQATLSDCFEQGYKNLSVVLNTLRVQAIMDRAEDEQQWPDEAKDPRSLTFKQLKMAEPALQDLDSDLEEAYALAWPRFEEALRATIDRPDAADRLTEIFYMDLFGQLQEEIVAIKADAMDELVPEMVKRYKQGKMLDDLLPEAFAVVREAGWRKIKMRHYDVQLIGGVVLHQGKIAEMRTGEGKTLVATAPVYLNALTGKGVHVVTVNDYLAHRDGEWMGNIYRFLGLTVGILVNSVNAQSAERREAYRADITYGTNNEFGFDYLRDNMVTALDQMVQRELNYAIVDEVDNILIDEARTPLIISGQGQESTETYAQFAQWSKFLKPEDDYTIEEKTRSVMLTEDGIDKIEKLAGVENIYDESNLDLTRYMENAIKAQVIFKRDKDYIVKDGEVVIVDEFTGRQMQGRRYSEGLHQAIEAKEGVKVQRENHTLATITFQNYFRLYNKLAGMTGTALTEAEEFNKIYELDVMVIPTNKPTQRKDMPDLIYRTGEAKFKAVAEEIKERHEKGQPVLVGTTSVEISEHLSHLLEMQGIPHNVLNAKYHEREAQIVAQAGRSGAVTIATNMAGRGTDILLGGNPKDYFDSILRKHAEQVDSIREMPERTSDEREEKEEAIQFYLEQMTQAEKDELLATKVKECELDHDRVVELGGLYIIGTERHESRRIDNQLRGRAGRQGDPGASRFFLALDDELMRRFAADRVAGIMERVGMEEDMPLESKMVSRFIESAQTRVEGYNFDIRKNVVEYDDVIAKQREVIYADRHRVLEHGDMHDRILTMIRNEVTNLVNNTIPGTMVSEEEELETLFKALEPWVHVPEEFVPENIHAVRRDNLRSDLVDLVLEHYEQRGEELRKQAATQGVFNLDPQREFERTYLLQVVDRLWMDHIDALDVMRAGIGFRSIAQRDPLVEFKNEAFRMFDELKTAIQHYTVDALLKLLRNEVQITLQRPEPQRRMPQELSTNADAIAESSGQAKSQEPVQDKKKAAAVRNDVNAAVRKNATPPRANGNGGARLATAPNQSSPANLARVGRNDPCPCGSGKKFKKCHGA